MNAKMSVFAVCVERINICCYIICMTVPLMQKYDDNDNVSDFLDLMFSNFLLPYITSPT